jgi:hypothetical protein
MSLERHRAGGADHAAVPPIVYDVLRSPGQPLNAATRAFFEPRFGHDFSQVRVHADAHAAESARMLNAQAYTLGSDIVFDRDRYAPQTNEGRHLIAHELSHVIQQRYAPNAGIFLAPDDKKGKESPEDKECKGSAIYIEVRKEKDLSKSFSLDEEQAALAAGAAEIFAPQQTTAVSQAETMDGTLTWNCPGGKPDKESKPHSINWKTEGDELESTDRGKLALDGHVYGLCCEPGLGIRKAAEKRGFNADKCNWTYVENFTATTSAVSGTKTLHRCRWGYHFKAEKGKADKKASVSYWGVDKEITV